MSDAPYDPGAAALPADLLQAFVAHSRDLLALTDATGTLLWANARFSAATGYGGRLATSVLDFTTPGASGSEARLSLARMLSAPGPHGGVFQLRGPAGDAFWVDAHCSRVGNGRIAWTMADVTRTRSLAARAARQDELLDTAQEFGRLGIWERDIPSGEGRWDKHVFDFWGIDPAEGTPNYSEAIQRIHPEDRAAMVYADSTRRAGRYAQRYRVVHPHGKTRWIHSQWEVKNGPRGVPDRALGVMVDDTEAYDAARALSDINAQLKLAVDLGKIASWRHDLCTGRMSCSDLAFELLGMAPRTDGFSIDSLRSLIHPDDLPRVQAAAQQALASHQPVDVEARYRHADGSWRYLLSRRVVELNAAGEAIAFVGVSLDMTERLEHLRHAEELAQRLDAASHAAGVGIWTTTADPESTDWNAQMFELFDRYEPPHAPPFRQWLHESVHPDDRARVRDLTRAYFERGDGQSEMELRTLRRDGSVRWIVLRAAVDREHAASRRVLGIAMDVTAQHRALDALREASQRAAIITSHAGIGTWEADVDGCGRWNEQMFHLRGLEPRDTAPKREEWMALVHPDDAAVVIDAWDPGSTAVPTAYEFRVRQPDGSYRWLASRSVPVLDDLGRQIRRVGVNWDVTESKNVERARQQAALAEREIQAKSQFLSRMSHELRTPLNAVLGFTQLLQIEARQSGHADQLAKLEHIRDAGDHLLSLINDVLDLSGLDAGEIRLSLRPVDLGELVRQSLPLLHSLAGQHGVELATGRLAGVANADPTRLRQVLINLLSNAIKYNRPGGIVVVDAEASESEATLTVRDTGRGLSAEQLAKLFEPFNRFGVEHEGIEGTGIGLTIVKSLVDGMGGRIAVDSQPNEGTVFRVTLPAASGPGNGAGANRRAVPALRFGAREHAASTVATLLYIEDNQVNVLLVEELVKSVGGLAIVSESSGAAGVERAAAMRPDLVLVDLQLPDFDGYEVLRRLRADLRTRSIPCVALSANAMREDIERGLASGFVDYWTKPIDFAVLVAALHRLFPALAADLASDSAVTEPAEHTPGE
jgi:signal transduction histidine kinase/ActR/RegA family two-component response regulator